MKPSKKLIAGLVTAALLLFIAWYFSEIVWYILISAVLSFMGSPVVAFFDRLTIGKWKFPHSLSSMLALLVILIAFMTLFALFVPLIATEARVIGSIDMDNLSQALTRLSESMETTLVSWHLMERGQHFDDMLLAQIEPFLGMATFGNLFKNIASFAGSLFMGLFSVLFITFFFLKDDKLFIRIILLFVDVQAEDKATDVIKRTKHLLSRYFLGICLQLSIMATMLSIGLYFIGVPNALLIGVFGGLINIIPYIGPIIGMITGAVLTALGYVALTDYTAIVPAMGSVVLVFLIANLIDNIILQPLIYSNSVKAHPLEIFLVIIMAGTLAGIPGMVLAIPAYTVLRIAGSEFLGEFPVIGKLTKHS